MIHFACVLRTGGDYTARYVNQMYASLSRVVQAPFILTCLTNNRAAIHPNVRIVPLVQDGWRGWWSKMELFRPGIWLPGTRVWYFDLDTLFTSNITDVVQTEIAPGLVMLEDFVKKGRGATGVMTWTAGHEDVTLAYEGFTKNSERIVQSCCSLGDQCWLGMHRSSATLQALFPSRFVSIKQHCMTRQPRGAPPGASVVCFHGLPRPHAAIHTPEYMWIREYWYT